MCNVWMVEKGRIFRDIGLISLWIFTRLDTKAVEHVISIETSTKAQGVVLVVGYQKISTTYSRPRVEALHPGPCIDYLRNTVMGDIQPDTATPGKQADDLTITTMAPSCANRDVKQKLNAKQLSLMREKFYLDAHGPHARKLEVKLTAIGAHVEKFLSKDITCIITDKSKHCDKPCQASGLKSTGRIVQGAVAAPLSRGQALLMRSGAKGKRQSAAKTVLYNDPISFAKEWTIRVVPLREISRLVQQEQLRRKPNQHNDPARDRRSKGETKIQPFTDCYLKVQDTGGEYRPLWITMKRFPMVEITLSSKDCPFDEPRLKKKPFKKPTAVDSACSGKHMSGKLNASAGVNVSVAQKSTKAAADTQRKALGGYCECCDVFYQNLGDHLNSDRHKAYAEDQGNFESLDGLVDSLPSLEDLARVVTDCQTTGFPAKNSSPISAPADENQCVHFTKDRGASAGVSAELEDSLEPHVVISSDRSPTPDCHPANSRFTSGLISDVSINAAERHSDNACNDNVRVHCQEVIKAAVNDDCAVVTKSETAAAPAHNFPGCVLSHVSQENTKEMREISPETILQSNMTPPASNYAIAVTTRDTCSAVCSDENAVADRHNKDMSVVAVEEYKTGEQPQGIMDFEGATEYNEGQVCLEYLHVDCASQLPFDRNSSLHELKNGGVSLRAIDVNSTMIEGKNTPCADQPVGFNAYILPRSNMVCSSSVKESHTGVSPFTTSPRPQHGNNHSCVTLTAAANKDKLLPFILSPPRQHGQDFPSGSNISGSNDEGTFCHDYNGESLCTSLQNHPVVNDAIPMLSPVPSPLTCMYENAPIQPNPSERSSVQAEDCRISELLSFSDVDMNIDTLDDHDLADHVLGGPAFSVQHPGEGNGRQTLQYNGLPQDVPLSLFDNSDVLLHHPASWCQLTCLPDTITETSSNQSNLLLDEDNQRPQSLPPQDVPRPEQKQNASSTYSPKSDRKDMQIPRPSVLKCLDQLDITLTSLDVECNKICSNTQNDTDVDETGHNGDGKTSVTCTPKPPCDIQSLDLVSETSQKHSDTNAGLSSVSSPHFTPAHVFPTSSHQENEKTRHCDQDLPICETRNCNMMQLPQNASSQGSDVFCFSEDDDDNTWENALKPTFDHVLDMLDSDSSRGQVRSTTSLDLPKGALLLPPSEGTLDTYPVGPLARLASETQTPEKGTASHKAPGHPAVRTEDVNSASNISQKPGQKLTSFSCDVTGSKLRIRRVISESSSGHCDTGDISAQRDTASFVADFAAALKRRRRSLSEVSSGSSSDTLVDCVIVSGRSDSETSGKETDSGSSDTECSSSSFTDSEDECDVGIRPGVRHDTWKLQPASGDLKLRLCRYDHTPEKKPCSVNPENGLVWSVTTNADCKLRFRSARKRCNSDCKRANCDSTSLAKMPRKRRKLFSGVVS